MSLMYQSFKPLLKHYFLNKPITLLQDRINKKILKYIVDSKISLLQKIFRLYNVQDDRYQQVFQERNIFQQQQFNDFQSLLNFFKYLLFKIASSASI
ncbi:unnamed protein product [Paramecium sonneborni]|uniref:Uncharacterized protein n=1 Tax=Paramecium sonneborni TaxID=65129 RepID=A0A8S1NZW2_9CILI|nr:unnamed protein product [Paramecium sonneborni]